MALGWEHDDFILGGTKYFCLASVPWVLIVPAEQLFWLPLVGLGFWVGGMWLSPDLDTHPSRPLNRWWVLKWIWWPYWKYVKHRGPSHLPFIGTMGRLAVLLAWVMAIDVVLYGQGRPTETGLLVMLWNLGARHPAEVVLFLGGVELAAQSHVWQDGILGQKYRELFLIFGRR